MALEQNDTQRRRSREQNDRMLQDAILTNNFCKQKEKEIDVKKKNSEIFCLVIFKHMCICVRICFLEPTQYIWEIFTILKAYVCVCLWVYVCVSVCIRMFVCV